MDPQSAFSQAALPGLDSLASGHAALDWSATVQPVFAPVQVFGQPGFEPPQANVAFVVLPLPVQAPLAAAPAWVTAALPVFEMPQAMMLPSPPTPPSGHVPLSSGPAPTSLPASPLPLPSVDALPARPPSAKPAHPGAAAPQRAIKPATAGKPAKAPRAAHSAHTPDIPPAAVWPLPAAAAETPAEREARAQMAKRIGALIVFLVPFTCLAVIWQAWHPQVWPANTGDVWWLARLVVLLVAAHYLWRLGLAIALRVLLSQRSQTLHTAREPGDPEVWGRLRDLVVVVQPGQGAGTLDVESAEYRRRSREVYAGLRAEALALWASLRASRSELSRRIRVAARDVAHGGVAPGITSIFGGGTGTTIR